jgi:hypothetical protein
MALEIIAYDPNEATETVDGIKVSANLLHIAHCRADREHKTHFIGVVDQKNPEFKEADPSSMSDLAEFVGMSTISRMIEARYVTTGYVLSDDRDEVLLHGCGRLVWVPPNHTKFRPFVAEQRNEQATVEQTKHTPGPYKVTNLTDVFTMHRRGNSLDGFQVADCSVDYDAADDKGIPHEERKANAKLFSAAPEMLSTLRDVLAYLQDGPGLSDGHALIAQIRTTINKAEGRE